MPVILSTEVDAPSAWTTLVDAVVLDDDPTSYASAYMSLDGYRGCWVILDIDSTGSPTTVQFRAQLSPDGGTTYINFEEGIWASMFFEDTDVASGLKRIYHLPCQGIDGWRMYVVGTGTDADNKFTITVQARPYR